MEAGSPRCVHYVGFRDDRYWSAYRIFGGPRFIHRRWDKRARRDVGVEDVVIFATGDEHQPIALYNGSDLDELDGQSGGNRSSFGDDHERSKAGD